MPSNVENILNAILTGDGSGIQKPASRVEELLFEIYEQGGGGGGETVIGGIKLTIDENYVMTATLVDKDGEEYGVSDDIDLPLETMVVDGEYDSQTQKIKLELKNGNFVEFSVADLVSGLQSELSSSNKLNPAYIAYDEYHRAVSDTEKNAWNAKQNAISDLDAIRSGAAAGATAVQPSVMQTALDGKQDTISDLATIRSGASAGATAVQPATMSAALAAKQDSLSETQLAAVNSGINSTKVAQIETNKTNIWYAINNGMANALVIPDQTQTRGSLTLTIQDGVAKITGTSALQSQATKFVVADHINLKAGTYYLSGGTGGTFGENFIRLGKQSGDTYIMANANNTKSAFTLTEDTECQFTIWAQGTNLNLTFYPMISPFSDIDFKRTLPNYDLTQLEQQDRNALAEQIDEGSKNIFDITTPDSLRDTTVIPLENGGAKLSCNNATWTQYHKSIATKTGEKYKVAIYIDSITGSIGSDLGIYVKRENAQDDDPYFELHPTATGVYTADLTALTSVTVISIYINNSGTSKTLDVNMRVMVCTEADWNISPNYAPYALPNYDLTELEAEDRAALVEVVDEGAKNKLLLDKDAIKSLNSGGTWSGYVYTPTTAPNLTATINDDGTVTLNGSTSSSLVTIALERKASSGFQGYVLSGSKANTKLVYQLAVSPYTVYATADGVGSAIIANYTDGSTIQLSLQIVANSTFSNTIITPMICTKADWDISPDYVEYALPNSDLTYLESQDRAALAEEIDAGPKNKFNVLVATAVNGIISNGTFTQDIADTKTNLELKFIAYSNGALVNLLAPRAAITITQNGIMSIAFICPPNVTELRFGHNGSPNDSVEVINNISLKPGQTYVLQLNILNCVQASGAYSWKDVMICTEADWKISQKFVPFTLKQPRVIFKNFSGTVSNTEAVIPDLSLTVNKTCLIRVSITATYNSNSPRLLRVATNNDMAGNSTIEVKEINSDQGQLSVVAVGIFYANSNNTVYISAKYSGTGTNSVKALYEIFEV